MKPVLTTLAAMISCLMLSAGVEAVRTSRSYHTSSKTYGKADYFQIKNEQNDYLLYLQRVKPSAKSNGSLLIGLPEPNFWHGFIARGFMDFTVNGIPSGALDPQKMEVWQKENTAGVDILFNFDGCKLTCRYFMREDSPVLWIDLIHDENSDSVRKIQIGFECHPSWSVENNGKPDSSYRRFIQTPARKIIGKTDARDTVWFNAKDSYLVFGDDFYQPGLDDKKSQGPCFLRVDWSAVRSLSVWFGNIYCAVLKSELRPEAGEWHFGVFETRKRQTNQEFLALLQRNKTQFEFKK